MTSTTDIIKENYLRIKSLQTKSLMIKENIDFKFNTSNNYVRNPAYVA